MNLPVDRKFLATTRWNDMVQDDEIERLMNCHHLRYEKQKTEKTKSTSKD